MFGDYTAEQEYEDSMRSDAMSDSEWHAAAYAQYVQVHGVCPYGGDIGNPWEEDDDPELPIAPAPVVPVMEIDPDDIPF